jgi:hypothetical protein
MTASQVMDMLAAERTNNAIAIASEVDRQMAVFLAAQAPPSAVVPPPFDSGVQPLAAVPTPLTPGQRPGAVEHTPFNQGLPPPRASATASTPVRAAAVEIEEDADDEAEREEDAEEREDGPVGNGTFSREAAPSTNALNPALLAASSAASTKRDARPPPASFYQDRIAPPEGMGLIGDSQLDFASEY